MTIMQAIQEADNLVPNAYTTAEKVAWLSSLDGLINREVVSTHEERSDRIEFSEYDENTPMDTLLLARFPYDNIYVPWLCSKIELANDEITKYNNHIMVFNTLYTQFVNAYNRENEPNGTKIRYF